MEFTKEKVAELQVAYDKAVQNGDETFLFDGMELFTQYAKYLLAYLKSQLK